ncbi:MAG: hypothetical protein KDH91_03130, partial [Rhodoferax sp.]|nr:hypothetical protein [Rhodoferax sp.]
VIFEKSMNALRMLELMGRVDSTMSTIFIAGFLAVAATQRPIGGGRESDSTRTHAGGRHGGAGCWRRPHRPARARAGHPR